jgi:hypothetical protein
MKAMNALLPLLELPLTGIPPATRPGGITRGNPRTVALAGVNVSAGDDDCDCDCAPANCETLG